MQSSPFKMALALIFIWLIAIPLSAYIGFLVGFASGWGALGGQGNTGYFVFLFPLGVICLPFFYKFYIKR